MQSRAHRRPVPAVAALPDAVALGVEFAGGGSEAVACDRETVNAAAYDSVEGEAVAGVDALCPVGVRQSALPQGDGNWYGCTVHKR